MMRLTANVLLKLIPVAFGSSKMKPGLLPELTWIGANRYPSACSQRSPGQLRAANKVRPMMLKPGMSDRAGFDRMQMFGVPPLGDAVARPPVGSTLNRTIKHPLSKKAGWLCHPACVIFSIYLRLLN